MSVFIDQRPPQSARAFSSPAVEDALTRVSAHIRDPELAWLFRNCLPNTLDTTVSPGLTADGRPDTFVITGDIDAMWLRDSTAQVWPYLPFAREDRPLQTLVRGVIHRQVACVLLDPYANAFYPGPTTGKWLSDDTTMRPGVHERKYELDSLCAMLRLASGYWRATGDLSAADADFRRAVALIVETLRVEQAGFDETPGSPYRFQRSSPQPSETLPEGGRGQPGRRCGLSRSPFRPSDDATLLPFLVPANAMAVVTLREVSCLLAAVGDIPLSADTSALAEEIDTALQTCAVAAHPEHGEIWAYEVDGFGNRLLMDDANVPSLLALPYLGFCAKDDPRYQRTRSFVLSEDNPYFSRGRAGEGIGGPHVGRGWIWPMATIMRALTATCDAEIVACLRQLRATHADTGFMHETFWHDDAARFTRPWFAWANTLFGELILTLHAERPHVLQSTL